ncbi:Endonuclease/exonuclease/phosphatase [Suillus subluteus]|nr:Endonuclease/exonuclease/phosphatase [Suillus subluteus]
MVRGPMIPEGTVLRLLAVSLMKAADGHQPNEHPAPTNDTMSVKATAEVHTTPYLDEQGPPNPGPQPARSTPLGRQPRPRGNHAQTGPQPDTNKRSKKTTRANIRIASLNMRGRWSNGTDKWNNINQIMRDKKIGIMAIQEMHLMKEEESKLNETFGQRIKIFSSIDPENVNAKGVAIVLNTQMTNSKDATSKELIPGRALITHLPWTKGAQISILTVYAPNEPSKNQLFWEELHTKLEGLPTPDIMLGDFNIVEDALDRIPSKQDNEYAVESLMCLKLCLDMRDGWRAENPDSLEFTFTQSRAQGGRQSRIDRIYVSEDFLPFSKEWRIEPSGIATDHQLVTAKISDI